jgi:hypothetical protein
MVKNDISEQCPQVSTVGYNGGVCLYIPSVSTLLYT